MAATPARLFRVALEVADPATAARFYQRLFDSAPRPVGGNRWYLDCDNAIVALVGAHGAPTPACQDLYFEVDDLAGWHARAAALGCLSDADVHGEPGGAIAIRPWGERSFYAEDPDGNGLCFVEAGTLFTGR